MEYDGESPEVAYMNLFCGHKSSIKDKPEKYCILSPQCEEAGFGKTLAALF